MAKKTDLAETIEKIISENPSLLKLVDKLFFKKSIKFGLIMSCLTAGVFSVVNGLIMAFNLGWAGWVIFGIILTSVGGVYTAKQLRQ